MRMVNHKAIGRAPGLGRVAQKQSSLLFGIAFARPQPPQNSNEISVAEATYFLDEGNVPNDSFLRRLSQPDTRIQGLPHRYLARFDELLRAETQKGHQQANWALAATVLATVMSSAASAKFGPKLSGIGQGLLKLVTIGGVSKLALDTVSGFGRAAQASTAHLPPADLFEAQVQAGVDVTHLAGYQRFESRAQLVMHLLRQRAGTLLHQGKLQPQ